MRIGLIASEAAPFAKTGGLGDVAAALARSLAKAGHDARLVLPLYASMKRDGLTLTEVGYCRNVALPLGPRRYTFTLFATPLPKGGPLVYFVSCPELYARPGIYAQDGDEHLRFGFLTVAALEAFQRMGFSPDVVHVHDWHTALAPLLLKTRFAWDRQRFGGTRTVLTIHNMAYQGGFPLSALSDLGLESEAGMLHPGQRARGAFSFLAAGLMHADALTAVSETNAREIQTPEHGFGLDDLLRARAARLVGIVNGIDAAEWDPANDAHLAARYSATDLAGKARCREALLGEAGLSADPRVPVLGMVSRLSAQKGFDLALEALPPFLARGAVRLVGLGSGSQKIAAGLHALMQRFPRSVSFEVGFSEAQAHRIEAGSDFFLMPSRFEPCGLNQMFSQRYGTPPIVHATGGLADTVEAWNPVTGAGTGFAFEHFTVAGLTWALEQALLCWSRPAAYRRVQRAGMAKDFSWERQIQRYEALYARLHGR